MTQPPSPTVRPKVFISYSWHTDAAGNPNEQKMARVRDLVDQFTAEGIDTVFDQTDLVFGGDLYQFMERAVNDPTVTHVLALCDESYQQRFDGGQGGLGTEGTILRPAIYQQVQQDPEHKKFIAAVWERGDEHQMFLPAVFRTTLSVDLSNPVTFPDQFLRLRNFLYNRPLFTKPALAPIPQDLLDGRAEFTSNTFGLLRALKQQAYNGNVMGMKLYLSAYLDALVRTVSELPVLPSHPRHPVVEVERIIHEKHPYLLEWAEFLCFAYGSDVEILPTERLLRFLESILSYRYGLERNQQHAYRDTMEFFVRQVFMYAVTAQMHYKRWSDLRRVLEHTYTTDYYPGSHSPAADVTKYRAFSEYMDAYGDNHDRGKHQHALLLQRLPQHPTLPFVEMGEADGVLLFYALVKRQQVGFWSYRELKLGPETSRFFSRANREPGPRLVRELLGVTVQEVEHMNNHLEEWADREFDWNHPFSLRDHFNMQNMVRP